LYPLFGILHFGVIVNNLFNFNNELSVVVTGMVVSALIGAVYFAPVILIPILTNRGLKRAILKLKLRVPLLVWLMSIMMIILGELVLSSIVVMIGSGALVLSTIALMVCTIVVKLVNKTYRDQN
ncbi:MAG: hypothetical protein N3F06_01515, partial [Nitrososphaerales archaeon]|nr:hypothetical protein [Nitrososphaerales archaeon]